MRASARTASSLPRVPRTESSVHGVARARGPRSTRSCAGAPTPDRASVALLRTSPWMGAVRCPRPPPSAPPVAGAYGPGEAAHGHALPSRPRAREAPRRGGSAWSSAGPMRVRGRPGALPPDRRAVAHRLRRTGPHCAIWARRLNGRPHRPIPQGPRPVVIDPLPRSDQRPGSRREACCAGDSPRLSDYLRASAGASLRSFEPDCLGNTVVPPEEGAPVELVTIAAVSSCVATPRSYSCCSNSSERPLLQYRWPSGPGPSSKTWP